MLHGTHLVFLRYSTMDKFAFIASICIVYFCLLIFVASYFYLVYATCFLGYQDAIHHYVDFIEVILGR